MKRRSTPLVRIGIFILVGFLILTLFIFFIGSKQHLFSSTVTINAVFPNVSGLKTGAPVEMDGINVGNVTSIKLPGRALDPVKVAMKIEADAMPLIHTDTRAVITLSGLVGDKYIMLVLGSDSSPLLQAGNTMVGEPSKDFSRITDTLTAAVIQVNKLTNQTADILKDIRSGKGTLGKLIYDDALYTQLEGLTGDVRTSVAQVTTGFNGLSAELTTLTTNLNNGNGTVGKLLTSDDLYNELKNTVATTGENIRVTSGEIRDAGAKFALAAGRIAEDAEALKHNFFFKGYFEDRGYWDATDFEQTVDRKIDSLNHLSRTIEEQLRQVRMSGSSITK